MQRTVVALLALGAVTGHVAVATAGVASLLTAIAIRTAVAALVLRAVASDVTAVAALVALRTGGGLSGSRGALAGDVTGHATAVARLLLRRLGALTAFSGCQTKVEQKKTRRLLFVKLTDVTLAIAVVAILHVSPVNR